MRKNFLAAVVVGLCIFFAQNFAAAGVARLSYQVHVQDFGWLTAVRNGIITGVTGQGKRVEAIAINLADGTKSLIQYNAHVQNIGWQGWKNSGEVAGTVGKSLRLEAIRIRLNKKISADYDIYYRAYVEKGGMLGWAKNGEPAGTAGASLRLEALQIKIVPKGSPFTRGGKAFFEKKISTNSEV